MAVRTKSLETDLAVLFIVLTSCGLSFASRKHIVPSLCVKEKFSGGEDRKKLLSRAENMFKAVNAME